MNSVATPRKAPMLAPIKLTTAELMRRRAIALAALENIAPTTGITGLVAREALAKIRGETRR